MTKPLTTPENALVLVSEWKVAYQHTFNSPHGKAVLDDLAAFCHARKSCVVVGDRDRSLGLEWRREVYLRIQDFLERTPEELVLMFTKPLEGDKANG